MHLYKHSTRPLWSYKSKTQGGTFKISHCDHGEIATNSRCTLPIVNTGNHGYSLAGDGVLYPLTGSPGRAGGESPPNT